MKKKRDVVINIDPFDLDVIIYNSGFTLRFTSSYYDKDGSWRRKIINIKLGDGWLGYIVEMLWKVINDRRDHVKKLENSMLEQE